MGVYSDRLNKRGLRHGSGQKMGVLGAGQARKNGGLRHGSGQKGGSLLRHIPVLDIYVSARQVRYGRGANPYGVTRLPGDLSPPTVNHK